MRTLRHTSTVVVWLVVVICCSALRSPGSAKSNLVGTSVQESKHVDSAREEEIGEVPFNAHDWGVGGYIPDLAGKFGGSYKFMVSQPNKTTSSLWRKIKKKIKKKRGEKLSVAEAVLLMRRRSMLGSEANSINLWDIKDGTVKHVDLSPLDMDPLWHENEQVQTDSRHICPTLGAVGGKAYTPPVDPSTVHDHWTGKSLGMLLNDLPSGRVHFVVHVSRLDLRGSQGEPEEQVGTCRRACQSTKDLLKLDALRGMEVSVFYDDVFLTSTRKGGDVDVDVEAFCEPLRNESLESSTAKIVGNLLEFQPKENWGTTVVVTNDSALARTLTSRGVTVSFYVDIPNDRDLGKAIQMHKFITHNKPDSVCGDMMMLEVQESGKEVDPREVCDGIPSCQFDEDKGLCLTKSSLANDSAAIDANIGVCPFSGINWVAAGLWVWNVPQKQIHNFIKVGHKCKILSEEEDRLVKFAKMKRAVQEVSSLMLTFLTHVSWEAYCEFIKDELTAVSKLAGKGVQPVLFGIDQAGKSNCWFSQWADEVWRNTMEEKDPLTFLPDTHKNTVQYLLSHPDTKHFLAFDDFAISGQQMEALTKSFARSIYLCKSLGPKYCVGDYYVYGSVGLASDFAKEQFDKIDMKNLAAGSFEGPTDDDVKSVRIIFHRNKQLQQLGKLLGNDTPQRCLADNDSVPSGGVVPSIIWGSGPAKEKSVFTSDWKLVDLKSMPFLFTRGWLTGRPPATPYRFLPPTCPPYKTKADCEKLPENVGTCMNRKSRGQFEKQRLVCASEVSWPTRNDGSDDESSELRSKTSTID